MGSILQVSVTGYVGSNPEVRQVGQNGEHRVASFSVAVNRTTRNGKEQTIWIRANAWNKLADVAMNYVRKGSLIQFTANWLRPGAWIDQSGNAQATVDIDIDQLILLDRTDNNMPHNNIDEDDLPI